jgi:KRAB domain-containing zinc finger protein
MYIEGVIKNTCTKSEIDRIQDDDKTGASGSIMTTHDVSKMLNNESDDNSDRESDNENTFEKKHTPNPMSCPVCHKQFIRKQDLEKHERVHTGEKPFKCDICDKYFSQSGRRNEHFKRKHIGIKSHICDICDKGFWVKGDMTVHKLSYHKDRYTSDEIDELKKNVNILSCYDCDKLFFRRIDLERHERIHTGDKPYKCDICESFFALSGQLDVHMKRHSGVKPFPCDICGKAFLQNYLLVIHKRIHTKDKPFSCDVCGMSFYENCKMQVHKRRHTEQPKPNPALECEFCEKEFSSKEREMLLTYIS